MPLPVDRLATFKLVWARPIGGRNWHAFRTGDEAKRLLCGYPPVGDFADMRILGPPGGEWLCAGCLAAVPAVVGGSDPA